MRDICARAHTAYLRAAIHRGETHSPPVTAVALLEHAGTGYVVLRTDTRVVAVYKITGSGRLHRLRQWPQALAAVA